MSYDTYKAPLTLKPKFSLQLTAFIIGLHSIAGIFVLLFFTVPLVYKICFVSIIGISAIYTYRLHVQKKLKNSIVLVMLSVDNQWYVTLAQQTERIAATLLPSSMINRHLIILNFKLFSGGSSTLIVPRDAVDRELARKLRARIRVMGL